MDFPFLGYVYFDIYNFFQEQSTVEKFKSQGGAFVHEFCDHGTRGECRKNNPQVQPCRKVMNAMFFCVAVCIVLF